MRQQLSIPSLFCAPTENSQSQAARRTRVTGTAVWRWRGLNCSWGLCGKLDKLGFTSRGLLPLLCILLHLCFLCPLFALPLSISELLSPSLLFQAGYCQVFLSPPVSYGVRIHPYKCSLICMLLYVAFFCSAPPLNRNKQRQTLDCTCSVSFSFKVLVTKIHSFLYIQLSNSWRA